MPPIAECQSQSLCLTHCNRGQAPSHIAQLDHASLLEYLVSFRQHSDFHEQCVERIFLDLQRLLKPEKLTVYARYVRRGGLDINPYRSTEAVPFQNLRLARQ
ncbi:Conserved hypothetical protein [Pseudomonas veronii 1YdBTEX2]|uniref:NADPH-dependent 7-cyano-7-deazaguanine reductase n=1 Tax=Pseudomonas veronii 1YdBTEX2 TaxID=1295141 RepID=A0A1D3JU11_PSEVE|nr:putative PreQ(1) synthase [Pseudomonas veronii]SBW79548.1 Conserved hypothetical protein [Pseudomonas veronii 1YdBTEX2]SBW79549.1 Conserved hypothetical protein [Pseudomonas veronii 1YdBTEX2]